MRRPLGQPQAVESTDGEEEPTEGEEESTEGEGESTAAAALQGRLGRPPALEPTEGEEEPTEGAEEPVATTPMEAIVHRGGSGHWHIEVVGTYQSTSLQVHHEVKASRKSAPKIGKATAAMRKL